MPISSLKSATSPVWMLLSALLISPCFAQSAGNISVGSPVSGSCVAASSDLPNDQGCETIVVSGALTFTPEHLVTDTTTVSQNSSGVSFSGTPGITSSGSTSVAQPPAATEPSPQQTNQISVQAGHQSSGNHYVGNHFVGNQYIGNLAGGFGKFQTLNGSGFDQGAFERNQRTFQENFENFRKNFESSRKQFEQNFQQFNKHYK